MTLHVFTSTNQCAHSTTADKGLLERLEPIRVATSVLMIIVAESRKCAYDQLLDLRIWLIDKEDKVL